MVVCCAARCIRLACGSADANAPPPIISYFVRIQIGLSFLVPIYSGCAGKQAVKRVSVIRYVE